MVNETDSVCTWACTDRRGAFVKTFQEVSGFCDRILRCLTAV